MTYVNEEFEDGVTLKKERATIGFLLAMITSFMFFDIVDDWYEGLSLSHLLPEIFIGTLGMGSAAYMFIRFAKSRHQVINKARLETKAAKASASEWQEKAKNFRRGLSEAINDQLKKWALTEAEHEICFLLLKGFSFQEIADLRKTTERTVRQQASIMYKKSGLAGRVQLSAFFLEDLLSPIDE